MLTGRQIARVMYQHCSIKGKTLDYIDFLNLSLVDLKAFEHSWDEAFMADIQPEQERKISVTVNERSLRWWRNWNLTARNEC